ncbi:hypothetical protein AVEN_45372-1 [Araneus ventricosus]|uniref:Uncharacterized protein n=1 Tax=Araneus ventricosus TaxID=182803 RepID=A0A4Y2M7Q3_ARAVE|nr:hypothetical protein AVEN_45372-1 [Araneus ventricosus]
MEDGGRQTTIDDISRRHKLSNEIKWSKRVQWLTGTVSLFFPCEIFDSQIGPLWPGGEVVVFRAGRFRRNPIREDPSCIGPAGSKYHTLGPNALRFLCVWVRGVPTHHLRALFENYESNSPVASKDILYWFFFQ